LIESVTKELLERLGKHLQSNVGKLAQVIYEWPAANVALKYPSLSIITKGEPRYENLAPYVWENEAPNASNKTAVKYVVGAYEWPLQLDLWTKSKEDRHEYYQKLFLAFNTNLDAPGINATMENYHDAIARYDFIGFQYQDDEISAQRTEWRVTMNVLAQCKAIVTKDEFAIITSQVSLTPTTEAF